MIGKAALPWLFPPPGREGAGRRQAAGSEVNA